MPPQNDPLAQLRDIHLPTDDIASWPLAIGWNILIAALLIALVTAIVLGIKKWRANAFRREALNELKTIETEFTDKLEQNTIDQANHIHIVMELSALLKRVALTLFPRQQVAKLSGDQWLAFLDTHGGTNEFTIGTGKVLGSSAFAPELETLSPEQFKSELKELIELSRDWISNISIENQAENTAEASSHD